MSTRLNLAGATVLPFQFPALGDKAAPEDVALAATPVARSDDDAALAETAAAMEAAAEEAGAKVEAELAAAREDGLQRGFAEGREKGYDAGLAEGVKAGEAKMMEAVKRMAAMIAKLGAPVTALEQPLEEAV